MTSGGIGELRTSGGVGSTFGAGVYILIGTVALEHTGPSLSLSFLIVGIAAAFSAFCYSELASCCPSAGSAYHYSYICIREGAIDGWDLMEFPSFHLRLHNPTMLSTGLEPCSLMLPRKSDLQRTMNCICVVDWFVEKCTFKVLIKMLEKIK
ncbi:hypothetical protein ACFE04_011596 [Oxalis oulophora]